MVWNVDGVEDCLASAYLELGQLEEAISEYERFLHIWKAADTDIPEVIAANKRLAAS